MKKTFLRQLYSKLKMENKPNNLEHNRLDFISDIIQYFKQETEFKIIQHLISMKLLFHNFMPKNWKGNSETLKYYSANKVLVRECTRFYFNYWLN